VPIYDYVCASCGQVTEVIHGIDAPGPRFCPACGREGTLRKSIAAPAVLFKGSGWAKKDRSSSGGARAKAGASTSDAPDGSGKDGGDAPSASASKDGKSTASASDSKASGKSASTAGGGED
jgi:putative FmdB family regulatory protein